MGPIWPCPGSTPEQIWIPNTILVVDLVYIMYTKFHQNPSSGLGGEVENVKKFTTDDRRQTDDRQTDGRRTPRYDNSSLEPSAQVS